MSTTVSTVKRIGVLCGTCRPGTGRKYVRAAHELGEELARRGAGLIYGAGGTGMKDAMVKAVVAGGAPATGVFHREEEVSPVRGELFMVRTTQERTALIHRLSDAFVALPGGYRTLDELLEIMVRNQLCLPRKMTVLLNVDGFFDPLLAMIDRMETEAFSSPSDRIAFRAVATPVEALDVLGLRSTGRRAEPVTV
ncbi:TIGR00730 family Rossman fold protein [Streptomyces sp. NPDC050504]|uniref:TIGR00730 family Rossman fold protein n=1 Tax=Streptomyces sp. NPDC050504 TaxID=3365618 RepID=UPI0037A93ABF